ncbi:hypothetical protein [Parachitinimonas caeni]|uniref:Uncharacterized protein n=1 Tax=Parachitinimonas caeni TaxID=3031301 RepID=A0ABT7DX69_9NEIS|nr:hypothetical protein [Parachitinimonas caeni]MDK2124419.1 hypothetical protein [Parachitinimonas caeni]
MKQATSARLFKFSSWGRFEFLPDSRALQRYMVFLRRCNMVIEIALMSVLLLAAIFLLLLIFGRNLELAIVSDGTTNYCVVGENGKISR